MNKQKIDEILKIPRGLWGHRGNYGIYSIYIMRGLRIIFDEYNKQIVGYTTNEEESNILAENLHKKHMQKLEKDFSEMLLKNPQLDIFVAL